MAKKGSGDKKAKSSGVGKSKDNQSGTFQRKHFSRQSDDGRGTRPGKESGKKKEE